MQSSADLSVYSRNTRLFEETDPTDTCKAGFHIEICFRNVKSQTYCSTVFCGTIYLISIAPPPASVLLYAVFAEDLEDFRLDGIEHSGEAEVGRMRAVGCGDVVVTKEIV